MNVYNSTDHLILEEFDEKCYFWLQTLDFFFLRSFISEKGLSV